MLAQHVFAKAQSSPKVKCENRHAACMRWRLRDLMHSYDLVTLIPAGLKDRTKLG